MSADLTQLRQQIDALDAQLLALLNQRAALARSVGERKGGAPAYRPEREAEILRRVQQTNPGPLPAERAVAVFREIISACRGMEQHIRVAFLGPQGTFSESAARQQFGAAVDYVPEASIDAVFRAVASGSTEFAVVPVENSTEGAISRTLDLLLNTPARICGEVVLRVEQHLMRQSTDLQGVTRVYSHAQSLAQCQQWLTQHLPHAERVPVSSNAEAARLAAQSGEAGVAAMAVIPLAQAVHHPQLQHRNFFHKFHDQEATGLPPFAVPTSPYRMSASPAKINTMPPRLGQHTDEILAQLGYSREDISRLRASKIV